MFRIPATHMFACARALAAAILLGALLHAAPTGSFAADLTTTATAQVTTTRTVVRFFSPSLACEVDYVALLPEPLEANRKYPVLYLLHGAFGSFGDWTEKTSITAVLNGRPLIVINPDGDQFGWYADSPMKPGSKYESFMTRDLIADVDKRFPTDATARCRGIAGLSMGGHGAIMLAARHPGLFGSASSMSGILNIRNHPTQWHLPDVFGPIESHEANWRQYNVLDLAETFSTSPVTLLFDCGTSDTAAIFDNRQAHEAMTNRAIAHIYREFPGAHSWQYWSDRLPEHLAFHEAACRGELPPPGNVPGRSKYTSQTLAFERENRAVWAAKESTRPIVLLGSSTFEGIDPAKLFPGLAVANRGISGDGLGLGDRGILHRLDCSVFQLRPRAVFLQCGTNDLAQTVKTGSPSVEAVAECFGEAVKRIRQRAPETRVFVVSCTPTRDRFASISPLIREYNAIIRKNAEAGDPMVSYVDLYSRVVGEDGLMKKELSRDGLHLNAAGYEILKWEFAGAMQKFGEAKAAETR